MGKQRGLLVSGSCLFVFHHTHIHIQDLMSPIAFNKKLPTCEGYCEENGDQIINGA